MDFVASILWDLKSGAYPNFLSIDEAKTGIYSSILNSREEYLQNQWGKSFERSYPNFIVLSILFLLLGFFYILVNTNKFLTCTGKTDKYSHTVWNNKSFQGNPKGGGNKKKNPTWQKGS